MQQSHIYHWPILSQATNNQTGMRFLFIGLDGSYFLSLQVIDLGQSSSSGGWQRQAACKLASHGHERDEREEKWS
jgi:hypothetical protein